MKDNVDWSKAPLGATHYDHEYNLFWEDGEYYICPNEGWMTDRYSKRNPLPKSGSVVEFNHPGLGGEWIECTIVGYFKHEVWCHTSHFLWTAKQGVCRLVIDDKLKFRPKE